MRVQRLVILSIKNGLLLVALALTAGLSAVTTMRVVLSSQEVTVPSVVNKPVPDAKALAGRRGLELRVEGRRHDSRVAAGNVAVQEPAAGATLKSQRSIRVWTSLGPRRLSVPALTGQSVRTARLTLDQASLPLLRVVEVDDPAPEGTVLVQMPPPGEIEDEIEGVSLLVSRGRWGMDYMMPDLIGRPAESVVASLNAAGLKIAEVRYRAYAGVAPGIVLRQLPPAGHRVSAQGQVSLDISKVAP